MGQAADNEWHTFRIFRQSPGTAGFQIDDNPTETVSEYVPTNDIPPYIDLYGYDNDVIVDWFRIRKWAGSDPVTFSWSRAFLWAELKHMDRNPHHRLE